MNTNKLLKSLVGTAALTISLSGVANTYALAAEADNAEDVKKPESTLVANNTDGKETPKPDVQVDKEKGEAVITFKDKDGNVVSEKTITFEVISEEKPVEDEKDVVDEGKPSENEKDEKDGEESTDKEKDGEKEIVGQAPQIVFSEEDGEPLKLNVGTDWNPLISVAAIDKEDGDLTDKIEYDGDVNVYTPGEYVVTYTVVDSDGNKVTAERTVQIGGDKKDTEGKDNCNTCDNGGVKVTIDNENTLNGEIKNSGEVQAGEVTEEDKNAEGKEPGKEESGEKESEVDENAGKGEGKESEKEKEKEKETEKETEKDENKEPSKDKKEPEVDKNAGKGEGEKPFTFEEDDEDIIKENEGKKDVAPVVENKDKGSGEKVYDSSDVTKEQKKTKLPDTGVENTSNAGLIASIGAMFAALGAFVLGRRKSTDKQ